MTYKLSDLCDVRDGTHDSPTYVEVGYPLVTSKNIVDGKLDLSVVNYITEEDYHKINERSNVDTGDIIMPMIGTIGNPYLVEECTEFAIKNVALIKFNTGKVINKYIWYFLQSEAFARYVASKNKGGTQKFLALGDIRNLEISAKTIAEQEEIIQRLDGVAKIIDLRKQELEELDNLIKARFVELFGEWKSDPEPLKSFLEDITYGFTNPMPDAEEGPWKVTAKDVVNGKVNYDTARKTTVEAFEELTAKSKPAVGDVLLTKDGTLGRCAVVEEGGICVNQSVAVLKCNNKILPKFLAILLQMPEYQREMLKNAGGGTIKHIYITKVVDMLIMVPTISQQLEFLSFVEQTDKSKFEVQKSLKETQLLLDSLMQKYFE